MLVLAEPKSNLVLERWARVARLGLHRESDGYPVGTSEADLSARRERIDDAFRDERELLDIICAQLASGPRVAIVADRDGVILSARADPHLLDPVTRVRLVAGARWDEPTRGTNAIGTALVEGRPVAVVGGAHFERRNGQLYCYSAPIRDAFGDIVAVLDASGPLASHDPSLGMAVEAAGVLLERALRAIAYGDRRSGALAAIEGLVRRSRSPAMLIEASGAVRVVNAAASSALPLRGGPRLSCERVFGVSFAELVSAAQARGGMRFETEAAAFQIAVDPIAGGGDRTLAVVVHFEPLSAAGVSREAPSARQPAAARAAYPAFSRILGQDPGLLRARDAAARFAGTSLSVLLLAETGTGKELFARAIHDASDRAGRPFVAVNCGALSPSLIASELFGYAPGAFTGAARGGSEGRLGAAHGGTLFLDEIAEMPEELQAALLRVLDDGVYQRVGESRERCADFRLLCATCQDLPALIEQGRFRSDLFFRIHGARITIPALRERTDTVWLAERLLAKIAKAPAPRFSAEAEAYIAAHDWPGNVRELKSAVAHAAALADGEARITLDHLPRPIAARRAPSRREAPTTRKGIVRAAIETTLRACGGNVSEAARQLGVGRATIYRALKKPEER